MKRKRTKARELALQVLFAIEISQIDPDEVISIFWQEHENTLPEIKEFADSLISGVLKRLIEIDSIITSYADNWKFSRLAAVDRNILRIGTLELIEMKNTPEAVVINEAVELAKTYSTQDSPGFVNGILDKIKELRSAECGVRIEKNPQSTIRNSQLLIFLLLLITGCGTISSSIKKDCVLQNNMGAKYIKLGLWHDAKLHLLKALELAPQKASVYNNLGIVYEYFNLKNEAKEAYQKAVKLDPQTQVYQENLILLDKELIRSTMTIKQDPKKTTSKIKISTGKITIKRMLDPKITIGKINRVALFAFSKDENDKDAMEISKTLSELFKIQSVEEGPFYILEDYEVKDLTQDEVITQQELEKSSKRITLNKILSTDGLFIVKINEFKDNRHKNFELKNYYSTEKKEFVYYQQPYIKREVKINMSISLFEGLTDNLLWNKEYKDEMSTTYPGDDETVIPLFDKRLFMDFINKAVSDFVIDTSPLEKVYERIVVMEK